MLAKACAGCIGEDNTAYIVNLIGNMLWFFSIMIGTEDHRINYFFFGLLRGIVTTSISYLLIKLYSLREDVDSGDLSLLNRRNAIMTIQGFAQTFCLLYSESPVMYTIASSGPVLVYILDYFLNSITITRNQLIGIIIACIGIVLTINSHLIYHWLGIVENMHSTFKYIYVSLGIKMLVALFLLVVTLLWAYAILLTKRLKKANVVHVNFHIGLMLIGYNAIGLYFYPTPEPMTFSLEFEVLLKVALPMSLGSGLYIGSLFLTKKHGNLTMMNLTTVFLSYLMSIVRYG